MFAKEIVNFVIFCLILFLFTIDHSSAEILVRNQYGEQVAHFADKESVFGAELDGIMTGLIWMADPVDACTRIKEPYFPINDTLSRFVLVNSTVGACTTPIKIANAQNANFDLVVIFGDSVFKAGDVVKLFSGTGDLSIPAVLIDYNDGVEIRDKYTLSNRSTNFYVLEVSGNNPDIHKYILVFSIVIGVCFVVILLFMVCLLVKYIQERRRSRRNRLSSRQIKQLPVEKYRKGSRSDVCAICLEEYIEGDKLRILPCSHAYHTRCVDPWLQENRRNCPLCKRKVHLGNSSSSESDSDSEMGSPNENTPLLRSPSSEATGGTFPDTPGTSGQQSHEEHHRRDGEGDQPAVLEIHIESSDSEALAILPAAVGSVNYAYEEEHGDVRPKSV